MQTNYYISRREHNLLLILASTSVVFAFSNFAYQLINHFIKPIDSFVLYDISRGSLLPTFNFLTLGIFIALFKSRRFIISSLMTSLSFIIFAYEFYSRVRIILRDDPFPELSLTEQLLMIANYFDYTVFLIVSVLLFWQISILLRMLIKTLQKDEALP